MAGELRLLKVEFGEVAAETEAERTDLRGLSDGFVEVVPVHRDGAEVGGGGGHRGCSCGAWGGTVIST
ncbi:hypothetical protein [Streptomyces luteocolor]|uniref:hypothetical protein n=1 Tax=Streptomyces luteocolor TaxID=285500 RepID=UPI00130129B7|nr:hypothetical protein [Streptomyces luteocolor]